MLPTLSNGVLGVFDLRIGLCSFGHEHRLAVYRLLVEAGPDGMSAGAIAGALTIPPSSLTFHTQGLLKAGLISQRRKAEC